MKRLLLICFLCLLPTLAHGDSNPYVLSAISATASTEPYASFALDAAGGSGTAQVYDSVAEAWVGGGADTADFTSGYLEADSTSDRCYIPGSYLQKPADANGITVYFEYQVSNATDANLYSFTYPSSSGDSLVHKPYATSGPKGSIDYRSNYGGSTASLLYDDSSYGINTWHVTYINLDYIGQTINCYIDGSVVPSKTESNFSFIQDPGTLAGNCYLGYVNSGTNIVRLRNFKLYKGTVTP